MFIIKQTEITNGERNVSKGEAQSSPNDQRHSSSRNWKDYFVRPFSDKVNHRDYHIASSENAINTISMTRVHYEW